MSVTLEEVKKNLTLRLEAVEGAVLSEEDMARVFGEEMDKSVDNSSSVFRLWLSKVSCTCTCMCVCTCTCMLCAKFGFGPS